MGQLDFHRILPGADDKIQSAIDRNRMNLEHNFARSGLGRWNIFESQDFRAAEFFKEDGFQLVMGVVRFSTFSNYWPNDLK